MRASGVMSRFHRPEYTGENRCLPCTIVNTLIAVIVASVVGLGLHLIEADPMVIAGTVVLILGVSAAMIYLRGYLVPGTPALTKRYFPDWILRLFDKGDPVQAGQTEFDFERILTDADIVEDCDVGDDLCLTDNFHAVWRDGIEERREADTSHQDLATLLDVEPDALEFVEYDSAFVAKRDGRRVGQWESTGAYVADMAAASALRHRLPEWTQMDIYERSNLLKGLRVFLERCPICDGHLTMDEDVMESCCRSIDVVAISCDICERRLFEEKHPGA